MNEQDLAIMIGIGGVVTTAVMSLIKRFAPDLSSFWRNIILLVISLVIVWGYQLWSLGFDELLNDPIRVILSMFAVTGVAVSVYEALGKPSTVSPRIEGTFEEKE